MSRGAGLVVALVLVLAGCSADASGPIASTSTRPPLGNPPDAGPAPDADGLDATVRDRVAASTVRITGIACGRSSEGSGFAVAEDIVVTNAHVLLGVDAPVIERPGYDDLDATVVAFDAVNDLALLKVDGAEFVPLELGEAPDGTVGGVFGWEPGPELEVTPFRVDRPVTVRIEAVGSDERISRPAYLIAAEIESGDSGAALVDGEGLVVGVAYATSTRATTTAYAVRSEMVQELIGAGLDADLVVPDCVTRRSATDDPAGS